MPWISVKLDEELKLLVDEVSKARGETVSSFVRRAILRELARLSFLNAETKKALEVR